ncbi:MAG: YveK family protein [Ardenticatenaceae bacterium]
MNLKEYANVIRERVWLVLLATLLTTASSYLWSLQQPAQYSASAILIMHPDSLDFGRLQASKQLLNHVANSIEAQDRAARIVDIFKLDQNPNQLLDHVTISPNSEQLTIEIKVEQQNPQLAAHLANRFAEEFVTATNQANATQRRQERLEVNILKQATIGSHTSPQYEINIIAGSLMGLQLGCLLVLALEYFDDTIKNQEDIERYVSQVTPLGQIPPH